MFKERLESWPQRQGAAQWILRCELKKKKKVQIFVKYVVYSWVKDNLPSLTIMVVQKFS